MLYRTKKQCEDKQVTQDCESHNFHSPLHSSSKSKDYLPSRHARAMSAETQQEGRVQDLLMAHRLRWEDQHCYAGETNFEPKDLVHSTEGQAEGRLTEDHRGLNLGAEAQRMIQDDQRVHRSGLHYVGRNCLGGRHDRWQLVGSPVPASW